MTLGATVSRVLQEHSFFVDPLHPDPNQRNNNNNDNDSNQASGAAKIFGVDSHSAQQFVDGCQRQLQSSAPALVHHLGSQIRSALFDRRITAAAVASSTAMTPLNLLAVPSEADMKERMLRDAKKKEKKKEKKKLKRKAEGTASAPPPPAPAATANHAAGLHTAAAAAATIASAKVEGDANKRQRIS